MTDSSSEAINKAQTPIEDEVKEVMDNSNVDPNLPKDFSLKVLQSSFEGCITEDGNLLLLNYITGFEELYKFLNLLGTVFGWVSVDIDNKLEVLRQHRKGDKAKEYQTIQDMVAFEVNNNLIKRKGKDYTAGTTNLLRIHRALDFIIEFLKGVPDLNPDDKSCPLAQEAYKKTLKKHHPWMVQKAALLAMHTLPLKKLLLEKISGNTFGSDEYKAAENILPHGVKVMGEVYEKNQ